MSDRMATPEQEMLAERMIVRAVMRLCHRLRGLSSVGASAAVQAAIQGLTFIAGLAVVRLLPVEQYALYTIANAALGMLVVLSDCGVSQSVLAQGGRVWQDPARLGGVIAGGLRMRRRFAGVAILVAVPALILLLRQQGASFGTAMLVALAIIPVYVATLTGQLLEVIPRLQQQLFPLQRIQLSGAAIRVGVVVTSALMLPVTWFVTFTTGLVQLWMTWRLRRLASGNARLDATLDPAAVGEMRKQVARMAPGAVYYAFSGQISVWLISLLGTPAAVAHIGALGRLSMAFNVFSSVFALIVVPRFARLESSSSAAAVIGRFWLSQAGLVMVAGIAVGLVAVWPAAVLSVLGNAYSSLTAEVVLTAAGGAVSFLAGSAYGLAAARGIVFPPWFFIPVAISVQIVLALALPIATVAGVLWMGLLTHTLFWLIHSLYFTGVAACRKSR